MNTDGLDVSDDAMRELTTVDPDQLREELPQVEEHLAQFGDRLPQAVRDQLDALKRKLS
jgi:phosphoenolpyruvate carboxykinase (GTP)